jgi:IS1 family transposase
LTFIHKLKDKKKEEEIKLAREEWNKEMGIEPRDNNSNREKEDNLTIHIASKSETCLIEAVNGRIKNYLARFNRKTKRYRFNRKTKKIQ